MPQASFLYPTELLTFNNIDVVQVSYQSIWNNVNLQVFCAIDRDSSEFALAKINQSKLGYIAEARKRRG